MRRTVLFSGPDFRLAIGEQRMTRRTALSGNPAGPYLFALHVIVTGERRSE